MRVPVLTGKLNQADLVVIPLALCLVAFIAWGSVQVTAPYRMGREIPISLDWYHLPFYALRTVLRMGGALVMSLTFTFTYGAMAAKSKRAERVLIPLLDVLQSIPILGFMAVTVGGLVRVFPNSILGAELASMFAIFTSQAWNMAFSLYQSLKTVPKDLQDAARVFRLSPWQRFWRLEVPFAMPGLVWNTMISVSGGWFFVVASEAIAVGSTRVALPGVGSYLAKAIHETDIGAVILALVCMLVVIAAYDQVFFRPLVAWSARFKLGQGTREDEPHSWILDALRRSALVAALTGALDRGLRRANLASRRLKGPMPLPRRMRRRLEIIRDAVFTGCVAGILLFGGMAFYHFTVARLGFAEVGRAFVLGLFTAVRVLALIAIATIVWVPVGVFIGLRPRLAVKVEPLAQFLAAFPANLMFPIAVLVIQRLDLSAEVWTAPLMILGTQWYILFNVIAGASSIPQELLDVSRNLRLRGVRLWKYVIIPSIVPYLATGLIAAAGGTWNASIVAELVEWGKTRLQASGLGAYIALATEAGDIARVVLGVTVMSILVLTLNRLLWHRLYDLAEKRFSIQ